MPLPHLKSHDQHGGSKFQPLKWQQFWLFFTTSWKKQTVLSGGGIVPDACQVYCKPWTSGLLRTMDPTYAQVAHNDLANMSVDDKLNFFSHEMGTVKQLTQQVQQQQGQISQLNEMTSTCRL